MQEACTERGANLIDVLHELRLCEINGETRALPYNEWSLDFLVDYIVNTHHAYVRRTLPEIRRYAHKVYKVHGDLHPELEQIFSLSEAVQNELSAHMMKEESILFPYVQSLVAAHGHKTGVSPTFGSVQNPIHMMEAEHEAVGDYFREIRALSNDFTPPADACGSYHFLYKVLEEFEDDLHVHIHLENNILFPKAIALENELTHA